MKWKLRPRRWSHAWLTPQPVLWTATSKCLIHLLAHSRQSLSLEIRQLSFSDSWTNKKVPHLRDSSFSFQSYFSFPLHLLRGRLKQMGSSKMGQELPESTPFTRRHFSRRNTAPRMNSNGKGNLLKDVCSRIIYASLKPKEFQCPNMGLVEQTMTHKTMKYKLIPEQLGFELHGSSDM